MRIGYGEDIHPLVKGRDLLLAGVKIPFEFGLDGHSDADVVYHSISDALLGSLALGDIGKLFPPSDDSIKGIDSSLIVKECYRRVKEMGYRIVNLDVSISAERPKLARYTVSMRFNIANLLETSIDNVSVKAMTNEGFDATGEGKAIRATTVLIIEKE